VVDQLEPDVEICVSDNGSTDGTKAVVEEFRELLGERLTYYRHSTNIGFTGNMLTSVAIAHGDFCWFLSSDGCPSSPPTVGCSSSTTRRRRRCTRR